MELRMVGRRSSRFHDPGRRYRPSHGAVGSQFLDDMVTHLPARRAGASPIFR